ncbi:hypothetical protein HPB49_012947 [Dermacentor silvarum]|uniref:Uncharacterized protein n=1 Tax=Dermacentor silvarum TaxID=543639 RepID=A0ACB8CRI4_DERSI|nr:hypothetical protein HPB49_012947 [Dermacentor silvarum]
MGYYDHSGRLFVTERLKSVIKCLDTKVEPYEVEQCVLELDCVAEVAVLGVAHPVLGEAPAAIVVLRPKWQAEEHGRIAQRIKEHVAGRTTLEALGINPPTQVASKRSLPPEWQQDIITRLLPRNMHAVYHESRRPARAKAYDKYSDQADAFFVDAAGPPHNRSTATVVHRGQVVDCISATGIDITAMEVAGIALAMRNPRATFVLTDSQAAYRNFARGQVGHLAHLILQQAAANRQEERLAVYKELHGGIVFAEELPKTRRGKVLRRLLLTEFVKFKKAGMVH